MRRPAAVLALTGAVLPLLAACGSARGPIAAPRPTFPVLSPGASDAPWDGIGPSPAAHPTTAARASTAVTVAPRALSTEKGFVALPATTVPTRGSTAAGKAGTAATSTSKPIITTSTKLPAGTGPCALLTDAQVTADLGGPTISAGAAQPGPVGQETCGWTTTSNPPQAFALILQTPSDITKPGVTPTSFFNQEVAAARVDGGVTALTGLGDQAYLSTTVDSISAARIFVLKGSKTITVFTYEGTGGVSTLVLRSLAALAATKL